MNIQDAQFWIDNLNMEPHPEGGYYAETYRSEESISRDALPERYTEKRSFLTLIYFLLKSGDVSHFHRLKSDEVWYFHAGSAAEVMTLSKERGVERHLLGLDFEKGERPQILLKAGTLFGARVLKPESYMLVSCSVTPGFDFDDFFMPSRDELLKQYPQYEDIVCAFTLP